MTSLTWLDALWQDLRFGARTLRKAPGFTAIVVFTLALGIGSSTAVFSLIDAVLLRVAPFPNPSQLVFVFTPVPSLMSMVSSMVATAGSNSGFQAFEAFSPSGGDFNDIRTQAHSFSAIALFDTDQVNLSTSSAAWRAESTRVTGDFFSLLQVAPEYGRTITQQDAQLGAEPVAVMSHTLWQSRFGSDRGILGRTIAINSKPYRIIGIMPPSFQFPFDGDLDVTIGRQTATDLWTAFGITASAAKELTDYGINPGNAVARLQPGVTAAQAQAEVATILARSESKRDPMSRGEEAMIAPFAGTLKEGTKWPLLLLFAVVTLVLLIACSNTASLLMARAASRLHEFSVRAALGAKRARLIRQLLTECLLIAVSAASLGIFIAYAAIRAVIILNPGNTPRLENARLNGAVLLFTLALVFLTSILFGLLPALSVSRVKLAELIQSAAGRAVKGTSSRVQETLIAVEVALCVVLLAGSGLFIRSLIKVDTEDKGFQPTSVVTAHISLDDRYSKPEQRTQFFNQVLTQIQQVPGITSAALADRVPLGGGESLTWFKAEDHPFDRNISYEGRSVSENYFSTLGIPVLAGRAFSDSDDAVHPRVVIVNKRFAQTYFPSGAIGKHIWNANPEGVSDQDSAQTIVGVVPDVRQYGLEGPPPFQVYSSLWQNSQDHVALAARSALPLTAVLPRIRGEVRALDSAVPVDDARMMDELVTEATAARRFQTVILSSFAGIALFLSLVGLYALMAYSVRQRTAEIGVRMALGALPGDVLRMVLRRGILLSLIGAAVGIAGGFAVARVVERFLFGVRALDPLALGGAIALLLLVALLACLIPARRAAKIDPMLALRHE